MRDRFSSRNGNDAVVVECEVQITNCEIIGLENYFNRV